MMAISPTPFQRGDAAILDANGKRIACLSFRPKALSLKVTDDELEANTLLFLKAPELAAFVAGVATADVYDVLNADIIERAHHLIEGLGFEELG